MPLAPGMTKEEWWEHKEPEEPVTTPHPHWEDIWGEWGEGAGIIGGRGGGGTPPPAPTPWDLAPPEPQPDLGIIGGRGPEPQPDLGIIGGRPRKRPRKRAREVPRPAPIPMEEPDLFAPIDWVEMATMPVSMIGDFLQDVSDIAAAPVRNRMRAVAQKHRENAARLHAEGHHYRAVNQLIMADQAERVAEKPASLARTLSPLRGLEEVPYWSEVIFQPAQYAVERALGRYLRIPLPDQARTGYRIREIAPEDEEKHPGFGVARRTIWGRREMTPTGERREWPLNPVSQFILAKREGVPLKRIITAEDVPGQQPEVRDYLIAKYGDTPDVQQAAAWAETISYSGVPSMVELAERVIAGEDPVAAMYGYKLDLSRFSPRDAEILRSYLVAAEKRGEDPEEALKKVQESGGYIEGSMKPWRELAFSVFLDPWDMVNILEWAGLFGDVARVQRKMDDFTTEARKIASAAADEVINVADPNWVKKAARKAAFWTPTPEMKATLLYEDATKVTHTAVAAVRARDAATARRVLTDIAEQPEKLEPFLGPAARSQFLEDTRTLMRQVVEKDLDKFASLQADEFNPAAFLSDLEISLRVRAEEIAGVDPKAKRALPARISDGMRSIMSDAYMSTNPAHWVNNAVGDIANMATDGFFPFGSVQDHLEYTRRLPYTTQRLLGVAGGEAATTKGYLAKVPGVERLVRAGRQIRSTGTLRPDKLSILGEEGRYVTTFSRAHQKYWPLSFKIPNGRKVFDPLYEALPRDVAKDVEWALRHSPFEDDVNDIRRAVVETIAPERISIAPFLSDETPITPAMRAQLERRLARAKDADEAVQIVDDFAEEVRDFYDRMYAAPTPFRRDFSRLERAQDFAEEAAVTDMMGRQMGAPREAVEQAVAEAGEQQRNVQQLAFDMELGVLRIAKPDPDGNYMVLPHQAREVLNYARSENTLDLERTREAVDTLRRHAWEEYRANPSRGQEIWDEYNNARNRAWDELAARTERRAKDLSAMADKIVEGKPLREVLPKDYRSAQDTLTEAYHEALADAASLKYIVDTPTSAEFESKLAERRLGLDQVKEMIWQAAAVNPDPHVVDILASANRDEIALARRARADYNRLRAQLGTMPHDVWLDEVDKMWARTWDDMTQRWLLAGGQVSTVNGVDLSTVAPEALADAANRVGVDISDMTKLRARDWQKIADYADETTQWATKQLERASRERAFTPDVIGELARRGEAEDLLYPLSPSDYARRLGLDPEQLDADGWIEIADRMEREGQGLSSLGKGGIVDRYAGLGRGKQRLEAMHAAESKGREVSRRIRRWLLEESGLSADEVDALTTFQERRLLQELNSRKLLTTKSGKPVKIGNISPERRLDLINQAEDMDLDLAVVLGNLASVDKGDPADYAEGIGYLLQDRAEDLRASVRAGVLPDPSVEKPGRYSARYGLPTFKPTRGLEHEEETARTVLKRIRPVRDLAQERVKAFNRMTDTSLTHYSIDDIVPLDIAHAQKGVAEPPTALRVAEIAERMTYEELDKVRDGVRGNWEQVSRPLRDRLSEDQVKAFADWLDAQYMPDYYTRQLAVGEAARDAADFALYDYRLVREGDEWLATAVPYPYWYTRTARNWAIRVANQPGHISRFYRWRKYTTAANEQRQLPSRLEGKVEVPAPWLPDWTGDRLYVGGFEKALFPWTALYNPYYDPTEAEEAQNLVQSAYSLMDRTGLRLAAWWDVPLAVTGVSGKDPNELWNVVPQTSMVQAATALLREAGVQQVPPGGIYAESLYRKMLGLAAGPEVHVTDQEPAMPYRAARAMISNELEREVSEGVGRPRNVQMALALLENYMNGRIGWDEMMGIRAGIANPKEPGTYQSMGVLAIAERNNWEVEDVRLAQRMLADGVQKAALERAAAVISAQVGVQTQLYRPGEQMARRQARDVYAARYSPLTGLGSREAYMEARDLRPYAALRSQTFRLFPGGPREPTEETRVSGEERLAALDYFAAADEIEQQYQQQLNAYIRTNPWDTAGAGRIRYERTQALAQARERYAYGGTGQVLWSVFGATPQEAAQRRKEQLLSVVAEHEPNLSDYTDENGTPDYDAWREATDRYYAELPERLRSDPVVAALAAEQVALAEGEEPTSELLRTVSREEVERYYERNASPEELAQRIWSDIYSEAWKKYREAVDGGTKASTAFQRYIENLPAIRGRSLAAEVSRRSEGRITVEQAREALAEIEFPSGAEAWRLKKPEAERRVAEAQDKFYTWWQSHIPPDLENEARQASPILAAIRDYGTRQALSEQGFTAEQWEKALADARKWFDENDDKVKGDPAQWAMARALNRLFYQARDQRCPNMGDVLAERSRRWPPSEKMTKEEWEAKEAFDIANGVPAYREFEKEYAAQHPQWAAFYRPWLAKAMGAELPEDTRARPLMPWYQALDLDPDWARYYEKRQRKTVEEAREEAGAEERARETRGARGWRVGRGGGRRGARAVKYPTITSWPDFAKLAPIDVIKALFRNWGEGVALSESVMNQLKALHKEYGWGTIEQWLMWLHDAYTAQFPSQASRAQRVPSVRYPYWLPGVR